MRDHFSFLRLPVLFLVVFCLAALPGCGSGNTPQGPEPGSVQNYLDENPEVAARVDEDIDEESDDGSGE